MNADENAARRSHLARLQEQASASDPEALWSLACAYEDGYLDADGTVLLRRNRRKAIQLYRRAAELGETSAMLNLAALLSRSPCTPADLAEALRWEKRAARRGDPTAAFNVGISYKNLGDYGAAVKWFRKAEACGDDAAWLELAKAELFAAGTRRNVKRATARLEQVAASERVSRGEAEEARILLGYLYQDGWLVRRSLPEGLRHLRRAARRGSEIAARFADCLRQ